MGSRTVARVPRLLTPWSQQATHELQVDLHPVGPIAVAAADRSATARHAHVAHKETTHAYSSNQRQRHITPIIMSDHNAGSVEQATATRHLHRRQLTQELRQAALRARCRNTGLASRNVFASNSRRAIEPTNKTYKPQWSHICTSTRRPRERKKGNTT